MSPAVTLTLRFWLLRTTRTPYHRLGLPVQAAPAETTGPSLLGPHVRFGPLNPHGPRRWAAPHRAWGGGRRIVGTQQGASADVGSTAVSGGARLELSPATPPARNASGADPSRVGASASDHEGGTDQGQDQDRRTPVPTVAGLPVRPVVATLRFGPGRLRRPAGPPPVRWPRPGTTRPGSSVRHPLPPGGRRLTEELFGVVSPAGRAALVVVVVAGGAGVVVTSAWHVVRGRRVGRRGSGGDDTAGDESTLRPTPARTACR